MSIKRKILIVIMVILGIMAIVPENQVVSSISLVGFTTLILSMKVRDNISRRKLIKRIDKENIECIKVKENNKWVILLMLVLLFNMYIMIKSRYAGFEHGNNYNITNLLTYTNSFELHEKVILLMIFVISIFFIINKIEEIEYKDSFIQNNKKVIKISKGFIDRKIVTDIETFKKVKILLECKN